MDFHHIGLATKNIDRSIKDYKLLGYLSNNEKIMDPIQNVELCFLEKPNSPIIELVSPLSELSPVFSILEKNGTIPYHTCFEVNDIELTIEALKRERFVQISKVVPAIAFNNRKICFLYGINTGLIELLEKK